MSEKISEALWKAFIKKQKLAVELDDKELLKALIKLDKTDDQKAEPRLDALKDLVKEIPRQVAALLKRKKELGDKPFGLVKDELYAMLEEAEALQQKTQAALDADDGEDEDSAASALVNPKLLLKQLNMCRQNPERRMRFAFVDAKDKQPAMLAMHPRVSARALFGKLQAAAGAKIGAYGSAWVDGMTLMLKLDRPLSGLVKKVRPPVKACGFRITKAVLWNEDGTVFEQDELPEEVVGEGLDEATTATGSPAESIQGVPPPPPSPSTTYETRLAVLKPRVSRAADQGSADTSKHQRLLEFAASKSQSKDFLGAVAALKQLELLLDKPTAKGEGEGVDSGVAFKARMAALILKIKEAQTAGHPRAQDAKLKASEAGLLAGKREYERAGALLDDIEGLLTIPPDGAADTGNRAPAANDAPELARNEGRPPDGEPAFDEAAFRRTWRMARDEWTAAIETVDAQIAKLQALLRDQADEDLAEIAEFGLPALTGDFKAPMMAALMDVDRAAGDGLLRSARRARSLAMSFAEYLDEAETVAVTDDNDFGVTVTIRKTIGGALRQIEQALAPVTG